MLRKLQLALQVITPGGEEKELALQRQEFVFRKTYLSVLSLTGAAVFLAVFIVGVLSSPNASDMFGAVVISFFIYILWLLGWRSAVRLNKSGITIDNFLVRHVIPWADLSQIGVENGLQFRLRDGQSVGSLVYGGALIGQLLGYKYTQRVADKMESIRNQLATGARDISSDCRGYSHKFHVALLEPLAILVILEAFSIAVNVSK